MLSQGHCGRFNVTISRIRHIATTDCRKLESKRWLGLQTPTVHPTSRENPSVGSDFQYVLGHAQRASWVHWLSFVTLLGGKDAKT
jgi:hypothetical protein